MDVKERVEWIKQIVKDAHADGIVYGNSGGKDCSLVSILCKMACDNTVGIIMPCESSRNFGIDRDDALKVAEKFGIKNIQIDITDVKKAFVSAMGDTLSEGGEAREKMAKMNINPRLRMITLYAYAQAHNMLVAGTGNRSEATMGYFTKWGDGANDFNPISDLSA
ncbi:MAG: NAD(+) synthase, partial [Eubacteriales bacterium]|nr:NAD(+) synthase [Eubacteriales bacterium]